jgi:hypothetical protein
MIINILFKLERAIMEEENEGSQLEEMDSINSRMVAGAN